MNYLMPKKKNGTPLKEMLGTFPPSFFYLPSAVQSKSIPLFPGSPHPRITNFLIILEKEIPRNTKFGEILHSILLPLKNHVYFKGNLIHMLLIHLHLNH